jgi:hypothetical protein
MSVARPQVEWLARASTCDLASDASALINALRELDSFLAEALARVEETFTPRGAIDALRGLHISREEVRRALQPGPGGGSMAPEIIDRVAATLRGSPRFAWLVDEYGLDAFESVALLIALAPEFDLRYQRIYGYLQDDVTRKRPTVDLVLTLLCRRDLDRIACRRAFASDSALVRNDLVQCVPDPNYVIPPLLAQYVKPDEQIVRFLAGDEGLDERLAGFARLKTPEASIAELPVADATRARLTTSAHVGSGVRLWLHGPQGVGKSKAAEAVAAEQACDLLELNLNSLDPPRLRELLRLATRDASLRNATLYICGIESAMLDPRAVQDFADAIRDARCALIVGSTLAPPAAVLGILTPLPLTIPGASVRAECWRKAITRQATGVDPQVAKSLGTRF